MRVLLVNPRMASGWKPYIIPPIGLCSLKASLVDAGIGPVRVLDASGMDIMEVKRIIEDFKPEVVGVTTFTEARHNALEVARVAKFINPKITTLLGGVHATHTYTQILDNYNFIDGVFLGESEFSLPNLFLRNANEVVGSALRFGSKVVHRSPAFIDNLDLLPIPDYSDLDISRYVDTDGPCRDKSLAAMETSRGCPYNCAFCSSKSVWGNIRFKSVDRVLAELIFLVKRYKYEMVSFVDDIFTVDHRRTEDICNRIILEGIKIDWKCQTRTDRVSKYILEIMKEAGCKLIAFGVESGSTTVLEEINKRESPDDIREAFRLCKQVGIESVFNIIVGSPGETKDTLRETRDLIMECRPDNIATAALRAYPGSPVWKLGIEKGLFSEDILLTEQESIHYEGSMTINEMYRELIKFRILQARLKGIRGWIDLLILSLKTLKSTPKKILKGVFG